jgi:dUTPase
VELRVSKLLDGAILPTRAHEGDAGLDLYAAEAAHIGPGERWGGELRVLLLNTDPAETFRVAVGDRIAQLVITPIALPEPVEAPDLAESARSGGGFGSSGR